MIKNEEHSSPKIGIMQGRLSAPKNDRIQFFPKNNWQNEFELCSEIGFSCIEWVVDDKNYMPDRQGKGVQTKSSSSESRM